MRKNNFHAGFIEVNIADLQNFLVDTERYAIGRMSYYPSVAIEMIFKYLKYATVKTRTTLARDIRRWMEGTHSAMDYAPEWEALLREIEKLGVIDER